MSDLVKLGALAEEGLRELSALGAKQQPMSLASTAIRSTSATEAAASGLSSLADLAEESSVLETGSLPKVSSVTQQSTQPTESRTTTPATTSIKQKDEVDFDMDDSDEDGPDTVIDEDEFEDIPSASSTTPLHSTATVENQSNSVDSTSSEQMATDQSSISIDPLVESSIETTNQSESMNLDSKEIISVCFFSF